MKISKPITRVIIRPDLEGITACANALSGEPRKDSKFDLKIDTLLFYDIPALIAYISRLEERVVELGSRG